MSGIVGIVNLDNRPMDRGLLQDMTDFLAYRGPDAKDVWMDGCAGFGHTMLRTTFESEYEHQPYSLDGQVWITADARIDGRDKLRRRLESGGHTVKKPTTDIDLILHAYHNWGEDCVQYLIGDFAFAIWDKTRQRLFCARDHLGIKPFYYAQVGKSLLLSNTLNCLRLYPDVSDELNESAIADFLLFGHNNQLGQSTFVDIQKLPPAHTLTWSPGEEPAYHRYWSLPMGKLIRFRRPNDYIDTFLELLKQAVRDRLRTNRVGVLMSGGLDSTSVTATANALLSQQFDSFDLHAFTFVYGEMIPDEERHYSGSVAEALGIPIHHIQVDDDQICEDWEPVSFYSPEPMPIPMIKRSTTLIKQFAGRFRIGLTGQGGDPLLHPASIDLKGFAKMLFSGWTILDILRYTLSHGRLPKLGIRTHLRHHLGNGRGHSASQPEYPPWLNMAFAERLHLRKPAQKRSSKPLSSDSIRSMAYYLMATPLWASVFEAYDPGVTHYPAELRHPFFDIRLATYLMALPPVPWCIDKELVRVALKGFLPHEVLHRPKTPLAGFPIHERLPRMPLTGLDNMAKIPELDHFVDIDQYIKIARRPEKLRPAEYPLISYPFGLAFWLNQSRSALTWPQNCVQDAP
jgi:asparagine synthase (glutamine-hydrolysing)